VPGLGSPWRWQHEEIYLRGTWRNEPGLSSVLTYATDRAMRRRFHPHEKPIPLMLALLQGTDGVIIDPTMGSGSTLRAALDLGRRAIGIDVDARHCAVAVRRLAQEAFQFVP
jgi:site-specific DNA-methyltransferase (adenine-specific)